MKRTQMSLLATAVGLALAGAGVAFAAGLTASEEVALDADAFSAAENPSGRYFITFAEQGLASYRGGVAGLARTAPRVDGVSLSSSPKLDVTSAEARAYKGYLAAQRAAHITAVENALGRPLDPRFTFDVLTHAVSASLTPEEAALVASVPGVASVRPVGYQLPQTFNSPGFIGAGAIWDGVGVPDYTPANRGEGVKVGIIDTGTFIGHPSFTNDPACGFSEARPKLFPRDCTVYSNGVCTGELPNADVDSHGVHVGSTAAGNTIDNTVTPAPLLPDGTTMSGVAPCATVYSYNVADHTTGALYNDSLMAAFSNAVVDQVDVVNYSIGPSCGGGNPWGSLHFLDMQASDILIAAAAGNTRENCPNPVGRVSNSGPWMMTVASSTQDKSATPQLTVTAPEPVPAVLQGIALTPGSTTLTPAETVDLVDAPIRTFSTNIEGCTEFGGIPPGTFGPHEIAVLRRGTCPFTEKIENAAGAGARFVVITNNQAGAISMDTTGAPANVASFSISDPVAGEALIAFAIDNPPAADPDQIFADGFEEGEPVAGGARGHYERVAIVNEQGDVLAGSSLRGPTQAPYQNLTKPDISAPGVSIFAAMKEADGNYGLASGTSMASPHIAGAAALIRATHPSWSPMEVKSALMTTAKIEGFQEDGTTPWTPDQVGNGRVDLTRAALAGLTMDESVERFLAANPSSGTIGQEELNLPSMRDVECGTSCSWTRTFRNRLNAPGTWSVDVVNPDGYTLAVTPASFTLKPGFRQTITITATAVGEPTESLSFGRIVLAEQNDRSPEQHLSVAVRGGAVPEPEMPTVICSGGACTFVVDALTGSFGGLGCTTYAECAPGLIWLNRFSPDPDDYPITITHVQTVFGNPPGWNAAGDKISVFVYQDDDEDPTNGATAVGTPTVYTMGTPVNSFISIPLDPPVVVDGPGEVLIALSNPHADNQGGRPSTWDTGPFRGRSYFGDAVGDGMTAPDLASPAMGLGLNSSFNPDWGNNWLLRATGTNSAGRPITLGD